MSNLDCWGPGESIDTHIAGVWNINDRVTFGYPLCSQCPGGPESAQNVKSWLLGSRGIRRHPYCRGLEQKGQSDLWAPSVSSVSLGPKSSQNVKSWLLGSRGVHRHPYCRGLKQKWQSDLRLPSVSSVSRWSWVSSKCWILIVGVQGSLIVTIT